MTSEPDSTPRRRPPTIDLTATEIETEPPAQPGGPAPGAGDAGGGAADAATRRAPGNFAGRGAWLVMAAAAGAIVMAAVFAALWLAGVLPAQNPAPEAATQPANTSGAAQISTQLQQIQNELQAQRPDNAFATRLAAVSAQIKVLGDSVAALNHRLDEVAGAAQNALQRANAAAESANGAAQGTVQRSDLDALAHQIAALQGTVKTLSDNEAHRPQSANDEHARAALAADALRAVVERGAPYQAELAAVRSLGADPGATAALEPFATSGVPTAMTLAQALAMLTPDLAKTAGGAPASGSFLGRLEDNARNLVRVTPVDAPPGDDPAAVIARLNFDAAHADIAAALADIAHLPQSAKTLAEPWVQKANARDAAIAAARRIATDALAALGTANTQ